MVVSKVTQNIAQEGLTLGAPVLPFQMYVICGKYIDRLPGNDYSLWYISCIRKTDNATELRAPMSWDFPNHYHYYKLFMHLFYLNIRRHLE